MKALLLDADSTIPNVALMKLSTYHKSQGDEVTLKELHITYYLLDLLSDWLKNNNKICAPGSECLMLQNMINSSREEIKKVETHLRGLGVEDGVGPVL